MKNSQLLARQRMAALLVTDNMLRRIRRLGVERGEFNAELIDAYASDPGVAALDASEVFAVYELVVRTGLYALIQSGDARLVARNGRASIEIGFSGLIALENSAKRPGA